VEVGSECQRSHRRAQGKGFFQTGYFHNLTNWLFGLVVFRTSGHPVSPRIFFI
jgi:hypothetical protein